MTTFYRVDGAKLTYAEYWRMSPGVMAFAIASGMKFFGFPFQFRFAIPRPDRLFLVNLDELPGPARRAMGRAIRSAEDEGLRLVFCHRLAVPEPDRVGAAALMLDPRNVSGLMIIYGQQNRVQQLQVACLSRFPDGTYATTTTMKKTMEPMPDQDIERYPGEDAGGLYRRHVEHVQRMAERGMIPIPFDPNRLEQFVLEREVQYVDFHAHRGVFVPMTEEELDAVSR